MSTRLPVFAEITNARVEPTRNLFVTGVNPATPAEDLCAAFTAYGPLHVFDTQHLCLGQVKVSYFDIRHAVAAQQGISRQYSVDFAEDPAQCEFVDYVTIETESPVATAQLFSGSVMEHRRTGRYLQLRFYDRRAVWQAQAWLLKQGCPLKGSPPAVRREASLEYVKLTRTRRKENRAEYVIDLEKIGKTCRTTVMIKNIPNKYTQKMLVAEVNRNHKGTFDFFYLPIDFKNKCNVGYAFINFVDWRHIQKFYSEFDGKPWRKFNSEKICALSYARIQGIKALISHFRCSSILAQDEEMRPLILNGKWL